MSIINPTQPGPVPCTPKHKPADSVGDNTDPSSAQPTAARPKPTTFTPRCPAAFCWPSYMKSAKIHAPVFFNLPSYESKYEIHAPVGPELDMKYFQLCLYKCRFLYLFVFILYFFCNSTKMATEFQTPIFITFFTRSPFWSNYRKNTSFLPKSTRASEHVCSHSAAGVQVRHTPLCAMPDHLTGWPPTT